MKRRVFVSGVAAAAAWPAFLREAFADEKVVVAKDALGEPPVKDVVEVAGAFWRASLAGAPLLVFVIPKDTDAKYDRGHAFGELLNHGGDHDLAPLAGCEIVCATMDGLRTVVPSVAEGEPLMVLVHADALPATSRHLDVELPTYRDVQHAAERSEQEGEDPVIARRIEALGKLLRDGLGEPRGRLADRAAEARAKLRDKAPAGTQWAKTHGCGVQIEGASDREVMGCGMGYIPEKSRRFLYFFGSKR